MPRKHYDRHGHYQAHDHHHHAGDASRRFQPEPVTKCRAAERLIVGTNTTGASDDIERATQLAKRMATEFGMSEKLGSVRYAGQRLQYLGGAVEDGSENSVE